METKICSKCSIEKPLTEYHKHPETKDKLKKNCKSCCKLYHQANRERRLTQMKQRSIEKKDELKIYSQQYYLENKERIKSKVKEYQLNNKEKILANKRIYDPKYNQKYPERRLWRNLLYRVLGVNGNPKTTSTYKMLGYNSKQLKEHLDKQGMDWGKHTIDHKVPLTWFKNLTPTPIVNALINLQPLTEEENKIKGNRFCSPIPNSYIKLVKPWIKKQYLSMLIQENDRLP
jgi:hypothetical protein